MALFLTDSFGKEPFDTLIGPIKDRGPASGLITRHGYIVAEWGDPRRVDMTQQRDEDVSDHRGRPGVAERADPRRQRLRARLHAAARRSVRGGAQREDQVGPPAAADQRLAGHLWGKPDWADRPEGDDARRLAEAQAVGAGDALQVQRRARQRDGARRAEGVAPAAAGGAAREGDGADRRLVDVALVRLREFVGGHRRTEDAVGERRRSLGRRHVHQLLRHGPLRLSVPAQRQVEGPARSSPKSGSRWRGRRAATTRITVSRTGS